MVPKEEPSEVSDVGRTYMYRARVLSGELPIVPAAPLLWGPIVAVEPEFEEGSEGSGDLMLIEGSEGSL